jgi:tRNA A37 threonylcarbamoyladenosine dehydratase
MSENIKPWMQRTLMLLGEEKLEKVVNSHVLVVGLGGVGGVAAEMIARGGVKKMTIVDADTVDPTNRNRQIPALTSTHGKLKAEVLAERLKDINPDIELKVITEYINDQNCDQLLDADYYDYAVDAIDTLSPKVNFILKCRERRIPMISSMGAGGRVDPSRIHIADISESHHCNLAKDVRKKLHKYLIYNGIKVVYSDEIIDKSKLVLTLDDMKKKSLIGTISYMPAIFGCTIASVVLRDLTVKKPRKNYPIAK